MSGYLWALAGLLGLAMTALRGMVSEEMRDRLQHLPHAILRLAARRLTFSQLTTVYQDEWLPELTYILKRAEARPITCLVTGTWYALGILISASRISHHLHRQLPRTTADAADQAHPDQDRQRSMRLSLLERDHLRQVALTDLACAVIGVFIAAQIRFGSNVTSPYLALSLALPVLWSVALWLAGAYNVRSIRTGADEFGKILKAGVSLSSAVAIFLYAINFSLSRGYAFIALPSITMFAATARYAMRKRLHRRLARTASTQQNLPDQG